MATKLEKCARHVNDSFSDELGEKFNAKFGRELETRFNILSMQLVSSPADGQPFTPEQKAWVEAWSDGYGIALDIVRALSIERVPSMTGKQENERNG